MKSYDETARTVLDRVHAYERAQVRRRTAMVRGAVTLCCLGIVFGLGFLFLRHGDGFRPQHVISGTDTSHTDPTDNTTNTDMTTDSNPTDTNVTDTEGGQTTSTDIPPLTFPFEGSHYVSAFPTGELPVTGSSNLFIGGGADGPGEVGDVQKRFPEAIVYYDDPNVYDLYDTNAVGGLGLSALPGKSELTLSLNGTDIKLRYQYTKTRFMYDSPIEAFSRYGLVDIYRGIFNQQEIYVWINRNTGLLEQLRFSPYYASEPAEKAVSESEALEFAKQMMKTFYGEDILEAFSLNYTRVESNEDRSYVNYYVCFSRMFGDYATEENVLIIIDQNGHISHVMFHGLGIFGDIDDALTENRVAAAVAKVKAALPDWRGSPEIARGNKGEFYLKFHYKANLYWLSIS